MISLSALLHVVILLIVVGLIAWLLLWLIDFCGLPAPFGKVARIIVAVVAVLILCGILLSLVSNQPLFRP